MRTLGACLKAYNYVKEFGEGVDRMCRELEAADCGDVIFFPYAFMLRATAMNRIGHALSDNERLNLSIMNDSPKLPYAIFQQQSHRLGTLRMRVSRCKLRKPTIHALEKIVLSFADNEVFGTKEICALISCSGPNAWRLILKLLEFDLVHPIKGNGKGRYMFKDLQNP